MSDKRDAPKEVHLATDVPAVHRTDVPADCCPSNVATVASCVRVRPEFRSLVGALISPQSTWHASQAPGKQSWSSRGAPAKKPLQAS